MSGYGSVDDASEVEQAFLDESLNNFKKKNLQAPPNDIAECVECGDDIGSARKIVVPSATKCIHCQALAERK